MTNADDVIASDEHDRDATIETMKARIRACQHCVGHEQERPLPHAPNPIIRGVGSARICIAGQAAGNLAHQSGVPFSDPSGRRLRAWMDVDAATFYDERLIAIVPMGFCFPGTDAKGGDLPPRRECAPLWREQVFEQLQELELVLLVGQYAQRWHLGRTCPNTLTETVLQWRRFFDTPPSGARPKGVKFLPMPHPSWRNAGWLKKNPIFENEVIPVLRQEIDCLIKRHG